jgi:HEAT repeat protein
MRLTTPVLTLLLATAGHVPAETPRQTAWKILQDGVNENSSDRRSRAVRALGLLPPERQAVTFAERALEDEKPSVRIAAATALGEMHARASIPKLREKLSDSDGTVVLAAAQSLVTLKDDYGYEPYYAVLTGQRKTGQGLVSEGLAMLRDRKKLAEFGFEEGIGFVPFGGLGFSAFKALTKDDVSPVRAAAARILAHDPDPRSGEALGEAVSDKSGAVRTAALEAIAKRGDRSLLSDILPALSDSDDAVRYTAASAVIRLTTAASTHAPKNPSKR